MDKTKLSIILLIISLMLIVAAVLINNNNLGGSQSNSFAVKYNNKPVSNSAGVYLSIEKTPQNSGGINENQ